MDKITVDDINKWGKSFFKAKEILRKEKMTINEADKIDLKHSINDALYLLAFMESQLSIEEPEGVLERAKQLQSL